MKVVQWGALLVSMGLLAAALLALASGDVLRQALLILSQPWGIVSLLDIGVGFLFVWGWIVYREQSPLRAIGWIVAILILGNIASALYVALAARGSGGDWRRFWLGARG